MLKFAVKFNAKMIKNVDKVQLLRQFNKLLAASKAGAGACGRPVAAVLVQKRPSSSFVNQNGKCNKNREFVIEQ